jgi:hypothetical protein
VSITTVDMRIRLPAGRSRSYRVSLPVPKGIVAGRDFVIARLDAPTIPDIGDSTLVIPAGAASIFS